MAGGNVVPCSSTDSPCPLALLWNQHDQSGLVDLHKLEVSLLHDLSIAYYTLPDVSVGLQNL